MTASAGHETQAGRGPDAEGHCVHWSGPDDVLWIALPCCAGFWGCRACHDEAAPENPGHAARWPADSDALALMCGRCGATMSVASYLAAPDACPGCGGAFNPRCRLHHHMYFALDPPRAADPETGPDARAADQHPSSPPPPWPCA